VRNIDRAEWIHQRKRRYMAQILELFEEDFERFDPEKAKAFKALVRARLNALAVDAADVMSLEGAAINQHAQDIRDSLEGASRR
jgi:hypothetical protein